MMTGTHIRRPGAALRTLQAAGQRRLEVGS